MTLEFPGPVDMSGEVVLEAPETFLLDLGLRSRGGLAAAVRVEGVPGGFGKVALGIVCSEQIEARLGWQAGKLGKLKAFASKLVRGGVADARRCGWVQDRLIMGLPPFKVIGVTDFRGALGGDFRFHALGFGGFSSLDDLKISALVAGFEQ